MATLQKVTQLINDEYSNLCKALSVSPVPRGSIDCRVVPDSELYARPGFKPGCLRFPFYQGDLDNTPDYQPVFPPSTWDPSNPNEWPLWRIELWHEVCHQVEFQVFEHFDFALNQREVHDWPEWNSAVAHMAGVFGVTPRQLNGVL